MCGCEFNLAAAGGAIVGAVLGHFSSNVAEAKCNGLGDTWLTWSDLYKFDCLAIACAVAGVLGRRGFPLEVAAAQVCREAGARVSTNLHVRDMDLAEFNNLDGRRLEVVADGLTLWQGAQLAIDTTLVSPLRCCGSARPRAADHNGAALDEARRRKERTHPELSGDGGRACLVVLATEVGGR